MDSLSLDEKASIFTLFAAILERYFPPQKPLSPKLVEADPLKAHSLAEAVEDINAEWRICFFGLVCDRLGFPPPPSPPLNDKSILCVRFSSDQLKDCNESHLEAVATGKGLTWHPGASVEWKNSIFGSNPMWTDKNGSDEQSTFGKLFRRKKKESSNEVQPSATHLNLNGVELSDKVKWLIFADLTRLVIELDGTYDARTRFVLRVAADWLDIQWGSILAAEAAIASAILEGEPIEKNEVVADKQASRWRKTKIGFAALGGAIAVGLTAGAAAPMVAVGLAALGGAATAVTLASSSLIMGSLFGAGGAGLVGYKVAHKTDEVSEFDFVPLGGKGLSVRIVVPGFIDQDCPLAVLTEKKMKERTDETDSEDSDEGYDLWSQGPRGPEEDETAVPDFSMFWHQLLPLDHPVEEIGLRWEGDLLRALASGLMQTFSKSIAQSVAYQGALRSTAGILLASLAWPVALLSAATLIDRPWALGLDRADKAGRILADILTVRAQGSRPVTLVGYSVGARLIFQTCRILAERNVFGVIEDVILCGAPVASAAAQWEAVRQVASGRVVNVYSPGDWALALMFRTTTLSSVAIAGLKPVSTQNTVVEVTVPIETSDNEGEAVESGEGLTLLGDNPNYSSDDESKPNIEVVSQDENKLEHDGQMDVQTDENVEVPLDEILVEDICGTEDVEWSDEFQGSVTVIYLQGRPVENVDASLLVSNHLDYRENLPDILEWVYSFSPPT